MNRDDVYKLYFNALLQLLTLIPIVIATVIFYTEKHYIGLTLSFLYFIVQYARFVLEDYAIDTIQNEDEMLSWINTVSNVLHVLAVIITIVSFTSVILLTSGL